MRSTSGFESQLFAEWTRLGGHQRALFARVDADVFLIAQEQERRQRAAGFDAARRDILRDVEDANGGKIRFGGVHRINVSERGISGA